MLDMKEAGNSGRFGSASDAVICQDDASENGPALIVRQAAWIARRCRLAPRIAATVAELALSYGRVGA
jgi:hypothetical protein